MTVQPRDRSVSIAASPVDEGADPPDWPNTPSSTGEAAIDTRMLSMLVCVRAVFVNASLNSPRLTLSNSPAGIVVRLVQSCHARKKLSPEDVSIRGKLVRLEQRSHANVKSVPDDVSIGEKLVRLEQSCHARAKLVPEDVSIRGKLVSSDQSRQKLPKSVTAP